MNITPAQLVAPAEAVRLQPLREVGSLEKTQFWADEDITSALRLANLRGISLDRLRHPDATRNIALKAG